MGGGDVFVAGGKGREGDDGKFSKDCCFPFVSPLSKGITSPSVLLCSTAFNDDPSYRTAPFSCGKEIARALFFSSSKQALACHPVPDELLRRM